MIGRISASEIWGAYFQEGFFFLGGGGGLIIRISWFGQVKPYLF